MAETKTTKKKVDTKVKEPKKTGTKKTATEKKPAKKKTEVVVETTVETKPEVVEEKQIEEKPEVIEEMVATETASSVDVAKTPGKFKLSKIQMIIAGVIAVIVLAGIGMGVYYGNLNSKYDKAMDLYNAKNYVEASVVFTELKGYKDSDQMVESCNEGIEYNTAVELFSAGNYVEAKTKFEAANGFADAATKINECNSNIAYEAADALYKEGKYFEAMNAFTKLGSFKDAADRAASCVQARPANKKLYHNGSYKSSALRLKVKLHKSSTEDVFIKIYTTSGKLVTTMYIRSGGTVTVSLPAGKYQIKAGYGPKDKWFGTNDAYGDFGYYSVLKNGTSETFSLKKNYIYTLSLHTTTTKGNVGSRSETRSNF